MGLLTRVRIRLASATARVRTLVTRRSRRRAPEPPGPGKGGGPIGPPAGEEDEVGGGDGAGGEGESQDGGGGEPGEDGGGGGYKPLIVGGVQFEKEDANDERSDWIAGNPAAGDHRQTRPTAEKAVEYVTGMPPGIWLIRGQGDYWHIYVGKSP